MHSGKHISVAQTRPVTPPIGGAGIVDQHRTRIVTNKDITVVFLGDHDIVEIDRGVVLLQGGLGNGHLGNGTEQNGGIDRGVGRAEREHIGIGTRFGDMIGNGEAVAVTVERGGCEREVFAMRERGLDILREVEGIDLYGLAIGCFGTGKANLAKIGHWSQNDGTVGCRGCRLTIDGYLYILRRVLIASEKIVGGIVLQVFAQTGASILDACRTGHINRNVPQTKRAVGRRGVLIPCGEAVLGLAAIGHKIGLLVAQLVLQNIAGRAIGVGSLAKGVNRLIVGIHLVALSGVGAGNGMDVVLADALVVVAHNLVGAAIGKTDNDLVGVLQLVGRGNQTERGLREIGADAVGRTNGNGIEEYGIPGAIDRQRNRTGLLLRQNDGEISIGGGDSNRRIDGGIRAHLHGDTAIAFVGGGVVEREATHTVERFNRGGTRSGESGGYLYANLVVGRIVGGILVGSPTIGGAVAWGCALSACPLGGNECVGGDSCLCKARKGAQGDSTERAKSMSHTV